MSAARIQLLSPRLANQIAAGEVVERPASVVKELLENSLDAGASRIDIEIERGGIQLIRITDNGDGIHPDDLPLALARHATSKIRSAEDLAAVMSLGFRGEALASIASVAKLLLISRRRGESAAWQAFAEGAGMQVQVQPAALNEGTRIEVRDLFFNTPARRRFLRSEATEFAHIDEVVRRLGLARPELSLSLKHNGRGVRQWRGSNSAEALATRVAAVLGRTFLLTAQPIDLQIASVRLRGFVGDPGQHRAQADGQFVFVNGRVIRDRVVSHAIRAGFADRIPPGRAPCYVLFLELPATDVDVNVHPTKHEVRFRNARWLHDGLTRVVADAIARAKEQIDTETGEVMAAFYPAFGSVPASMIDAPVVRETAAGFASSPSPSAGVAERLPATSPLRAVSTVSARPTASAEPVEADAAGSEATASAAMSAGIGTYAGRGWGAPDERADRIWLQRVSPTLLLDSRDPVRLWPIVPLLRCWLQSHWLAATPVVSLPLLLPVMLPALPAAGREWLARQGFQLQEERLLAAPSCLRGVDWRRLLPALATAPVEARLEIAVQHLLEQSGSAPLPFWQTIVSWADTAAAELAVVPTRAQWEALCPG